MGAIGEYIISVTSAALVCSCVQAFFEGKGTVSTVLKLLCGIFLSLVALRPVVDIDLAKLPSVALLQRAEAESLVEDARQESILQQRTFISERSGTYITQKGQELGCELDVKVFTDDSEPFAPNGVEISGSISPYARGVLTTWITENLAIKAEDQKWIG